MKRGVLKGDMVLDTSVLIEIALASTIGKKLIDRIINGEIKPYTTTLNIIEAMYVICRLLGMNEAKKRIDLLKESGYIEIISSTNISIEVAECKCLFPISIADCHTLALAKTYRIPPLFYRLEKEFEPIIEKIKQWINNEVRFVIE